MDDIKVAVRANQARHAEWAYQHRKPVHFIGDMLDSDALFAKLVILRAATLCSFVLALRFHGGVSKDDLFRNPRVN